MSIHSINYVMKDTKYYIDDNYKESDLLRISRDIVEARKELEELEKKLFQQFNKAAQAVKCKEVICKRYKAYRGNVELYVYVNEYLIIGNDRIGKNDMNYPTHKKFKGTEKKQAKAYAEELKKKHGCKIVFENWI